MTSSILKNCSLLVVVLVFVNAFVPSLTSSHSSDGDCPKLTIECPADMPESGKTYAVKVRVEGNNSNEELSYNWSVSNSEIVEGQGTSSVKFRISEPGKDVTATVEVNGLKVDCDRAASCSLGVPEPAFSPSDQSDRERLRDLKRAIDVEIGEPHADSVAQCKYIGFGAKPCGGPWTYLVYSTARTDESKLQRLVEEYNELQKKISAEEGLGSDCSVPPEPELVLEDGVCSAKRR